MTPVLVEWSVWMESSAPSVQEAPFPATLRVPVIRALPSNTATTDFDASNAHPDQAQSLDSPAAKAALLVDIVILVLTAKIATQAIR